MLSIMGILLVNMIFSFSFYILLGFTHTIIVILHWRVSRENGQWQQAWLCRDTHTYPTVKLKMAFGMYGGKDSKALAAEMWEEGEI